MKTMIRVMKALSDPNRVKAVKLLLRRELCVCELTEVLGLAQPTVSKHMKILEDAGLVESRKEKAWVIYRPATGAGLFARTMLDHLGTWLDDDDEVCAALEKLEGVDRNCLKK